MAAAVNGPGHSGVEGKPCTKQDNPEVCAFGAFQRVTCELDFRQRLATVPCPPREFPPLLAVITAGLQPLMTGYRLSALQMPGPWAEINRNTKQKRMASSPWFSIGNSALLPWAIQ